MRLRTLTLTVLGAGATIAAALMLWVGTASAAATHPYLSDITEVPASTKLAVTGPLSVPSGLAFTAGDLWVASAGRGHAAPDIDEFASPSGSFLGQITYERFDSYTTSVAVSRSSGEVYLADSDQFLSMCSMPQANMRLPGTAPTPRVHPSATAMTPWRSTTPRTPPIPIRIRVRDRLRRPSR